MILVISSEMFQQWRIVFERSNGAAFVQDADADDDDAVPENGWRSCNEAGKCRDDNPLRVTGELHFINRTHTNYGYFRR